MADVNATAGPAGGIMAAARSRQVAQSCARNCLLAPHHSLASCIVSHPDKGTDISPTVQCILTSLLLSRLLIAKVCKQNNCYPAIHAKAYCRSITAAFTCVLPAGTPA